MDTTQTSSVDNKVLPEDVPVVMPHLPARLPITTTEQLKAVADPTRDRILGIIQQQPATAKQIATRLNMAPGTIGHHLQVLEAAGLAQVAARRLVRGIVAKYYTRTARIFDYCFSPEIAGGETVGLRMLTSARTEYAESLAANEDFGEVGGTASPRARISLERAREFDERLKQLVDDFVNEPYDSEGEVYTFFSALFKSPPYLQVSHVPVALKPSESDETTENP